MKILSLVAAGLLATACFLCVKERAIEQGRKRGLMTVEKSLEGLASARTRVASSSVRQPSTRTPVPAARPQVVNEPEAGLVAKESGVSPGLQVGYALYQPQATVDYIRVVIDEQRLYAFSQGELVMVESISTASTGINLPTEVKSDYPHNHLGVFAVRSKDEEAYSDVFDCPMPYAMFYCGGHAVHQTEPKYYRLLGQPASHGCVREGPGIAKWLFEHTPLGTPVDIVVSQFASPPSLKAAG